MYFDSVGAALAMDGHGVYVWFIVIVSWALIGSLLVLPILSGRRFLLQQQGLLRREQRAADTAAQREQSQQQQQQSGQEEGHAPGS